MSERGELRRAAFVCGEVKQPDRLVQPRDCREREFGSRGRKIVEGMTDYNFAPIERRRTERGWSAEELARRASLAGRTIRNVEKGLQRPSSGTLKLLALALRCSPDDLIADGPPGRETNGSGGHHGPPE